MLLGAKRLKPAGQGGLRIKTGEIPFRRVKNHVHMLTVGLTLIRLMGISR